MYIYIYLFFFIFILLGFSIFCPLTLIILKNFTYYNLFKCSFTQFIFSLLLGFSCIYIRIYHYIHDFYFFKFVFPSHFSLFALAWNFFFYPNFQFSIIFSHEVNLLLNLYSELLISVIIISIIFIWNTYFCFPSHC